MSKHLVTMIIVIGYGWSLLQVMARCPLGAAVTVALTYTIQLYRFRKGKL